MSRYFLHLTSPERDGTAAVIAGDADALWRLRDAVDQALADGAGAARFYSSDGEAYDMLLIREQDMDTTCTAYRNETAPQRSLREIRRVEQLGGYVPALRLLCSIDHASDRTPSTGGHGMACDDAAFDPGAAHAAPAPHITPLNIVRHATSACTACGSALAPMHTGAVMPRA